MPDESSLPPGQVETRRFPLVGEATPFGDDVDPDGLVVEVTGLVEAPFSVSIAELRREPATALTFDLHCVTGWTRRAVAFVGFPLARWLDRARAADEARFVRLVAHSRRGHDTTIPVRIAREGTWVVHGLEGGALPLEHGGPVRTLTPGRYLYKSLKWLRRVELLATDPLGYWEREAGYHNDADPSREERFVTGTIRPEDVLRLRTARRLGAFRGRRLLGVDLAGWDPLDRDLRGLAIRASDLRGARLDGVDLREANLSRSDLRGASLRGADLRGADVEGADLRGADLEGADLRGAALTAVRLADEGSRVAGLRWRRGDGLLEADEAFLLARRVPPEA